MKKKLLLLQLLAFVAGTGLVREAAAQTPAKGYVNSRLVAAPGMAAGTDSVMTAPQPNSTMVPPMPSIDNGPRDLIPTDLSLKRFVTADFEGQFSQDAAVYLPIYYHAGYLLLSPEDRLELKRLEGEISSWVSDQEALNQRGATLLERLQALHERGRPRGVIEESQLLVPYGGSESKVRGDLDPLVIVRQNGTAPKEDGRPNAITSNPRVVTPIARPSGK